MAKSKSEKPDAGPKKPDISKNDFLKAASPLAIDIGGVKLIGQVKEFESGSYGWYAGDRVTMDIGGKAVRVQVGINMTVVYSKNDG